jgi:hypothetical protein
MVSRRAIAALFGGVWLASNLTAVATAAETDLSKTAGGVTVYLGIVPAEIVKACLRAPPPNDRRTGALQRGAHEYHVVAAVFDATSGVRVSDAVVTAEVSGLGLSGAKKKLEPMQISGTTTYGGFFDLPGFDLYTVKLAVERSGASPAALQFKYDHRR